MLVLEHATAAVELAERVGDGLTVTLFWDRDGDGRLWVSVRHQETDEILDVVAAPDNALDVFYHPFAYCLPEAA